MKSEHERIARLREILGDAPAGVRLGIGDDAAVLDPGAEPLVWTVDSAVEGVHFRRDLLSFEDLGWRATMAAASDLAAMGAAPAGLLAALVLPRDVGDDDLEAIARGQRAAAAAIGTAIVGGNLARGGELSITTTALGRAARPLRRDGARAGDALWLGGPVGHAAAGLAALLAHAQGAPDAVAAWRRPRAQIAEGLAVAPIATAAVDVSDGVAADASHVARASGVLGVLEPEALVDAALEAVARTLGRDPLALALDGGEDYVLLVAARPDVAVPGFTRVGRCEPVRDGIGPVALQRRGGPLEPLTPSGFDHFRVSGTRSGSSSP